MPTINEMIDFCEEWAAYDCFSNEQFARREMFYAISDELKKALREQKRPYGEWIPCSERLPEEDGKYLVTMQAYVTKKPIVSTSIFVSTTNEWYPDCIAWMPLPKPYKAESEEAE